jgi:hypothetical protein
MLSYMAMSFFRTSPLLAYPLAALAIFMGVFFVIALRTYARQAASYEHLQRLPLEDGAERARASLAQARTQTAAPERGLP